MVGKTVKEYTASYQRKVDLDVSVVVYRKTDAEVRVYVFMVYANGFLNQDRFKIRI